MEILCYDEVTQKIMMKINYMSSLFETNFFHTLSPLSFNCGTSHACVNVLQTYILSIILAIHSIT